MRVIRLILGLLIITQGIITQEWSLLILGIIFTIIPIFNKNCCGPSGCEPQPRNRHTKASIKDVSYEEIR